MLRKYLLPCTLAGSLLSGALFAEVDNPKPTLQVLLERIIKDAHFSKVSRLANGMEEQLSYLSVELNIESSVGYQKAVKSLESIVGILHRSHNPIKPGQNALDRALASLQPTDFHKTMELTQQTPYEIMLRDDAPMEYYKIVSDHGLKEYWQSLAEIYRDADRMPAMENLLKIIPSDSPSKSGVAKMLIEHYLADNNMKAAKKTLRCLTQGTSSCDKATRAIIDSYLAAGDCAAAEKLLTYFTKGCSACDKATRAIIDTYLAADDCAAAEKLLSYLTSGCSAHKKAGKAIKEHRKASHATLI